MNIRTPFGRAAHVRISLVMLCAAAFAGCGPVHLVAKSDIPQPLIQKLPAAVALYVPTEFSEYVHKEERSGTKWQIELGKAQTETVTRLVNSMFEQVIPVDSVNAASSRSNEIKAILEPSVEEFAFVTPRDAGSPYFAVSIKYRLNVYSPDGKLADSWGFTGYGTAQSQGVIMDDPLIHAISLAMRDAGAKLAVEFREQPMVRDLIPNANPASATAAVSTGAPKASEAVATQPENTQGTPGAAAASSPNSDPAQPNVTSSPGNDSRQGTAPTDASGTAQPAPPNQ